MALPAKAMSRHNVLNVLRRGSKGPTQAGRSTDRQDDFAPPDPSASGGSALGLLDLPPELRNAIYAFVACSSVLTLVAANASPSWKSLRGTRKAKEAQAPINPLLLASKQCRREYTAVLFSTAEIHVDVRDFDFAGMMRISSRFSDLEAKALLSNERRFIMLNTQNCTAKALLSLKRWLDYRRHTKDPMPWKYKFPMDKLRPPTSVGRMRLLRELEYYADTIATLEVDLDQSQQAELKRIVEAFETEIHELDGDVGWLGQQTTAAARNVRGLMGGGLR